MRKSAVKSWLSLVLCLALLAAALCSVSLADKGSEKEIVMTGTKEAPVVLGEGKTAFLFQVIGLEEKESWFEIHTDAADLGTALTENGLVSGDMSEEYGLFVNSVCGTELTWSEETPYFWSLYVNDAPSDSEVSFVPVEPGVVYSYRVKTFTY